MDSGESMKVRSNAALRMDRLMVWLSVDYILFFTGDVTVTPNENEIRDHKYVSKQELQDMFADPGAFLAYHKTFFRV